MKKIIPATKLTIMVIGWFDQFKLVYGAYYVVTVKCFSTICQRLSTVPYKVGRHTREIDEVDRETRQIDIPGRSASTTSKTFIFLCETLLDGPSAKDV